MNAPDDTILGCGNTMNPIRRLSLPALHVLVLCLACGPRGGGAPNVESFDGIVTKEVLASAYANAVPLSFQVLERDGSRIYESAYQFRSTDPAQHHTCSITIAKVGTLLDPKEYEKRYSETERDHADRGPEYLLSQFPRIGRRAQRDTFGAGPGGSSFGLTFTTTDGLFDVRITVSNLLPEGVADPAFDIEKAARKISELYDQKQRG